MYVLGWKRSSLLWKKSIDDEYDDARLLGLEIDDDGHTGLIVNIYMPYDCSEITRMILCTIWEK